MAIEVKHIITLNELFTKIWKRYGQGPVLKRKMKEDFNRTLKDIFQKNLNLMKKDREDDILSP